MSDLFGQHSLDLSWVKVRVEEGDLLDIFGPEPLAQFIQLLHAQCSELTRECATLKTKNRVALLLLTTPCSERST